MAVIISFTSCKQETHKRSRITATTLLCLREHLKKYPFFNDSIQIKYFQVNNNTQNVSRIFCLDKGKPVIVNYTLTKCGDSLIYIKPSDDSIGSIYIDKRSSRASYYVLSHPFNTSQEYLEAGLRYIKEVIHTDPSGQEDIFMILYGKDVGFIGSDSLYYYFDKNIHLRKTASQNGKILYCDKKLLLQKY